MMKKITPIFLSVILAAAVLLPAHAGERPAPVRAAFIQLNPELAGRGPQWWDGLFSRIAGAGIREVIVQYLAEGLGEEAEDYLPLLEKIFPAAEAHGVDLILGLEHDPGYWVEITAPEKVLRDYFLLRAARNLKLQNRLLELYGSRASWTGYYIPDEIDDLSWRDPSRRELAGDYLRLLASRLREADPGRAISVSAFFRGRTEPDLAAGNLFGLVGDSGDLVLLQDGQGGGDPPPEVLPLYYRAFLERRPRGERPRLAPVVEVFEETTGPEGKFSARPAAPGAVEERLRAAAVFPEICIFSFAAYADPEKDGRAAAVYDTLIRNQPGPRATPARRSDPPDLSDSSDRSGEQSSDPNVSVKPGAEK